MDGWVFDHFGLIFQRLSYLLASLGVHLTRTNRIQVLDLSSCLLAGPVPEAWFLYT